MKTVKTSILALLAFSGCSVFSPEPLDTSAQMAPQPQVVEVQENPVPGTVTEPWEEANFDYVEVPAQLDPTGVYYRPAHKTIVEIYPGRKQFQQFPADAGD